MSDRTWQERADRLHILAPTIARATGVSVSTVHAYRRGARRPSETWLVKVDWMLTDIERTVDRGRPAA